jgi:ribonuclease HI
MGTSFSSALGYIGHSTNNVAELWGLTKGLQMAIKNNFSKLIVEGDSQIIINLLRKILNGASPDRISPSWRLLHGLQSITDSLRPNLAIIPAHVRRSVNQVADELANIGINRGESELICSSVPRTFSPHSSAVHWQSQSGGCIPGWGVSGVHLAHWTEEGSMPPGHRAM